MKDFRTELKITPSRTKIHLSSRVLTQGSCFSNAIGERLANYKLKAVANPFGVIYNPESIHKVLSYCTFNEPLPEHTFVQNDELFLNYNFHSAFSSLRKDELVSRIRNAVGSTHYALKDTGWLVLTYGTAWVYHRRDTGEIVANCHKLPTSAFSKGLMTIDAITTSFKHFFEHLKKFNPAIKVILTVSPVRHLRDSLELNSLSKSILRVACHEIAEKFDDVEYFPAYEMMMDDLRDYRFYKSDMLHPTAEAEEYIWEKFMERYFSDELKHFVGQWSLILNAMRHRPFHPGSTAHQQFLLDLLGKLEKFRSAVDVQEEIDVVKRQMQKQSQS
ncbi:MAG: GSCFA domain-containing protein [Bacteroidota bacterium]|nr:GSCFA domain-containing protein [Bacteroidota bacterium]